MSYWDFVALAAVLQAALGCAKTAAHWEDVRGNLSSVVGAGLVALAFNSIGWGAAIWTAYLLWVFFVV